MRPIYEINKDIERCILEGTNYETGEFLGWELLNDLEMERGAKLKGVALSVKDLDIEIDALEKEIDRLTERRKKAIKNRDGRKFWLEENLKGENLKTTEVECINRKSYSVEVDDEFLLYAMSIGRSDLINHKETVTDTPDKAKIKEFLKSGGQLAHCKIVEKNNITVR